MLLLIPLLPFAGFLFNATIGRRAAKSISGTVDGQIIVFFVMTVAAAEAAVGLALVIALFRHRETLSPDAYTALKW